MTSTLAADWIDAFAGSLPASYRDRHTREAIGAHAAISRERGARRANVGRFDSPRGNSVVCVVADDRPGLLSHITAAFVVQGWDVVHAEAYTRPAAVSPEAGLSEQGLSEQGLSEQAGVAHADAPETFESFDAELRKNAEKNEAVDLFWLKRNDGHGGQSMLLDSDVEGIRETLIGMLEGRLQLPQYVAADEPPELHNTRVRFIEGEDGTLCTLEVETRDRSGLLLVLTRALSSQRVTITRSEVRTFSSRVFDRFTIAEFDGSPISESRRLSIQVGILSAIETPWTVPAYKAPPAARERRAQIAR